MFEFAVVLLLKQLPEWRTAAKIRAMRRKKANNSRNDKFRAKINSMNEVLENPENMRRKIRDNEFEMEAINSHFPSTHKIDVAALFSFYVFYVLFNCVYWIYV